MFSPQDAQDFLALLFKTPDFLQHISYSNLKGVRYFTRNVPYVQPPSLGLPRQIALLPLDFSVQTTEGTVVPQRRWTPTAVVDVRRHVENGVLELPIFFVNHNGGIGFRLSDILQDRHHDLCNGDGEAPLGGKTTIYIRINVSSHMLILAARLSFLFLGFPHSGLAMATGSARYLLATSPTHGGRSQSPVS